jgi:hypothetical protein
MPLPADDRENMQTLIELIAGRNQPHGVPNDFLTIPQVGASYMTGTMLPVIGGPALARPATQEFRVPGSAAAALDFYGTYVTTTEYGLLDELIDLQRIADEHDRESLILGLVAVNMISHREELLAPITDQYIQFLKPDVGDRLRQALTTPTGGLGRQLLAPQPILASLRWLLGRPPRSNPVTNVTTPFHAILFSHAFGSQLVSDDSHDLVKGDISDPSFLMLSLMNLGELGAEPDVLLSIDRTVRLWREFGHLAVPYLKGHASDIFRNETGLDPADFLAVGFALLTHFKSWEPGQPLLVRRELHENAPTEIVNKVLGFICRSLEDCQQSLGDPVSEHDILAIESHPILEVTAGIAVLDQRLLWKRCTTGLFWILHDRLKATSESAAALFRQAYGAMVEASIEDIIERMTPPVLGATKPFYTEHDMRAAYGDSHKTCDAIADFGSTLMLVEIVNSQLSVPARVGGDLNKLEDDFAKLVFGKCEQLHSTAALLIRNEEPLTGVRHQVRHPKLLPVLVIGGGLHLNSLSYSKIRRHLATSGHLQQGEILPLCVLKPEDVERLEALAEHGTSPTDLLGRWQASDLCDLPLENFLYREQIPVEHQRPKRTIRTTQAAFDEIVVRIGMMPEPEPGSSHPSLRSQDRRAAT